MYSNDIDDLFVYCHYKVYVGDDVSSVHVIFRESDLVAEDGKRLDISELTQRHGKFPNQKTIHRLVSERVLYINNEKVKAGVVEPLYITTRGLVMDGESLLKKFKA